MAQRIDVETLRRHVDERAASAEPLDRLRAAVAVTGELREAGDLVVDDCVARARGAGCSWSEIGAVFGVSKQAAQQRFIPAGESWPGDVAPGVHAAIAAAQEHARRLGHNYLGTEHLLVGLVAEEDSVAARALASLGVTADAVLAQTRETVGIGCEPAGSICVTPRTKRAVQMAKAHARRGGLRADTEHLLLALVALEDGLAAKILRRLGATPVRVREELARLLGSDVTDLAPPPARRRRLLGHR